MISGLVSMLPIHLYSEDKGSTEAIDDERVRLLNDETGDLLDGVQFKAALVEDYLLEGNAYAYVRWKGLKIESLHYVECDKVGVQKNADPIYKTATISVLGRLYEPYKFIRLLNNSRDGVTGSGIVNTCNAVLDVARQILDYELMQLKNGGNKKGFLKSKTKLTEAAMSAVKSAWARLWNNKDVGAMVLNDGMDFQETSATSVEMQLSERKTANAAEISRLLNIPQSVLDGTATGEAMNLMIRTAVIPILTAFEAAINRAMLLESEKDKLYFAFDTKDLFKGEMLARYQAYQIAIRSGWLQPDEVRYFEDLPPLGIKFVRLGLQDVYYDPETGSIYTPNTNQTFKLGGVNGKEGSENDDGVSG